MEGDGYVPVRREPKPGAAPSMANDERDALERLLACPCPCTMDIFTCRTSMPSCGFSPRIHRDVVLLVEGGYSGSEILAAFDTRIANDRETEFETACKQVERIALLRLKDILPQ